MVGTAVNAGGVWPGFGPKGTQRSCGVTDERQGDHAVSETREYVFECPQCGERLRSLVPPVLTRGRPEVWCFRILAHKRSESKRMRPVNAAAKALR